MILFLAMIATTMACQQVPDPAALRSAHYDPAKYFDSDRLRLNTVTACRAGTAAQQLAWIQLYACRISVRTDLAKRSGWKPAIGSPR